MDNQPRDRAKCEEWAKFWESEMGQEAIARMESIRDQKIKESMGQADAALVAAFVGRAAGIEMILQDIQAGFDMLARYKEQEEKEGKQPKKK